MKMIGWDDEFGGLRLVGSGCGGAGANWRKITGNDINYSAQDSDILTAIGYRPDAPSRDDNHEKFTPAQNMIYARRRAGLAAQ
ncbi:phage polarity suppression protein [Klebsiella pneumoniae]|nr:phage polarity suppression protein [Klebsiella pneumoniae]